MANKTKKPKLEDFQQIAKACGGILTDIASKLGVNRCTIREWTKTDPKFAEAITEASESLLDLCESNLRRLIAGTPRIEQNEYGEKVFAGWEEPPNLTAIIFTLKTKGKNRGYTEQYQIEQNFAIKPQKLSDQEAGELLNQLNNSIS